MAYKLVALDLDDTLLDSQKRVSGQNKDAIERMKNAGIHVVLASGRIYHSIAPYNKALGLHDYTIACAGAQAVNADGEVVYSNYIPPTTSEQVMRWAERRGIYFQVYLDDGFYYLRRTGYSEDYERMGGFAGAEDPCLLSRNPLLAAKIILIDENERLLEYQKELAATFADVRILLSQSNYLEVLSMDASKGNSLAFIAGKLGIEREQVIAVGDSQIDASMIEYAGLGIAVANACPECLKAADYVTASNEENGVAKAIDKHILF
ncbi:MAG TPA: hypothetical protein DEB31_04660 [Clostridiales bacterium]|nr:hypothetical protein [Clostridiales bacterium]